MENITDYNKIKNNTEQLMKQNSKQIMMEAIQLIAFKRDAVIRKIIFVIAEAVVAVLIAVNEDTIGIVKEIAGYIGQIQVGLIGVVFTGYALFQALISDELLMYLLESEEGQKSKLKESNEYFIELVILQILILIINLFIYVLMCAIPKIWCLTSCYGINVSIASVFILVVFYINIETIWELKSFIFNVFQLFNAYAVSRVISKLKNDK